VLHPAWQALATGSLRTVRCYCLFPEARTRGSMRSGAPALVRLTLAVLLCCALASVAAAAAGPPGAGPAPALSAAPQLSCACTPAGVARKACRGCRTQAATRPMRTPGTSWARPPCRPRRRPRRRRRERPPPAPRPAAPVRAASCGSGAGRCPPTCTTSATSCSACWARCWSWPSGCAAGARTRRWR